MNRAVPARRSSEEGEIRLDPASSREGNGRGRGARIARLVVVVSVVLIGVGASALPVAAISYGTCVDSLQAHYFSFTEKSSGSSNVRNVQSNLITRSKVDQFRPCSWNNAMNGASAWVAIEPGSGNPQNGNVVAILQIGVAACAHYIESGCQSYTKRLVWAEGGCGLSVPDYQDLGVTIDDAYHVYEIRHLSGDTYRLSFDGVAKLTFVGQNHDDIKCWIGSNYTKGAWAMERWDRGDGLGDITHKTIFGNAKMMWGDPGNGGSWAIANFTFCSDVQPPSGGQSHCAWGDSYLNTYTVN